MKVRISLLIFALSTLSACVGGPMAKKSSGVSDPDFMTGSNSKKASVKSMKKDLSRDFKKAYFPYFLYVEATLQTKPYLEATTKESVETTAFKEKWPQDKTTKESESRVKAELAETDKETCFSISVQTDDMFAKDSKAWHGELISGDSPSAEVTFTEFGGFSNTTRRAYVSQNSATVLDETVYFMFSTACSSKAVDLGKPLVFKVQPRYKPEVGEFNLVWGLVPTEKKGQHNQAKSK